MHEEYDKGLSSIAAPIFNYTGQVVAAISVAGPTNRIIEEQETISTYERKGHTNFQKAWLCFSYVLNHTLKIYAIHTYGMRFAINVEIVLD
jgi:hypothetical protein